MRYNISLAALAATLVTASPAFAQAVPPALVASSTAQADVKGVVLNPLTLEKVRDLDFGTVISTSSAGTVTIDADTGNRTVSGGVLEVSTQPGSNARFGSASAGTAGRDVELTLTSPAEIFHSNGTDKITVENGALVLDQGGATSRTIDSSGALFVHVGGTFELAANQKAGNYSSEFELTANYY
jgi:hypothetical protein